jgi:hypothetical protein
MLLRWRFLLPFFHFHDHILLRRQSRESEAAGVPWISACGECLGQGLAIELVVPLPVRAGIRSVIMKNASL